MDVVSLLIKPASGMCNMSCEYCFYCDEQKNRSQASYGMMEEKTLKNLIRKFVHHAEKMLCIMFQGGEPTLCGIEFYRKVVSLVNYYNQKNIYVTYAFQTNAINITEEWASFFAENHFLVGISLDGVRETHNKYRHLKDGGDTYDAIISACRTLDRYHVEYNILTVLHKETAMQIEKIYRKYRKAGFFYQQYIACMDSLQDEKGSGIYSLTPELYGQCLTELFQLWYRDQKKGIEISIRQFDNWIHMLKGHLSETCEQRGCCGVQYVLEANGNVYPCDFFAMDQYLLGNINQNKVLEIDQKREEQGFLKNSMKLPEECCTCPYLYLCRNGCKRNRFFSGEDYGKNYYCEGYRYFFSHCLEQMKELASK